jgi:hypothetical protein
MVNIYNSNSSHSYDEAIIKKCDQQIIRYYVCNNIRTAPKGNSLVAKWSECRINHFLLTSDWMYDKIHYFT